MDAGLAAVVGGAIGGSLAGLTAVGTSWFTLRVARLQVASQETEAARQRRFEGLRERREPRAKAYADFTTGGQRVVDLLLRGHEDLYGALTTELHALSKLRATVTIWGPESVALAAAEVLVASASVSARIARESPPGPMQFIMSSDVAGPLNGFIEAARAALEDDGIDYGTAVSRPA
ncbi:hypothetical protein ACFYPZ_24470 [Streptomyces sp. NPDC005506]|uniref:hypothetical protein n=1 Tax=Streptomyces sp. NPDC005506 TaxID=3364718 RepID=UPI003684307A